MGLVEATLEHLSFKSVALFLIIAYSVWHLIQRLDEHRRIRKLGKYGPYLRPKLPWGTITSLNSSSNAQY